MTFKHGCGYLVEIIICCHGYFTIVGCRSFNSGSIQDVLGAVQQPSFPDDVPCMRIYNGSRHLSTPGGISPIDPLSVIFDRSRRWPDGIVYYEISPQYSYDQLVLISTAMRQLEVSSSEDGEPCIQFKLRRRRERDYLYISMAHGCWSFYGRIGGGQVISIGDSCMRKGIIMHELMHAIGFVHEHQRADRDYYVYINYDNIEKEYYSQFNKWTEGLTIDHMDTPYDYSSLMHYARNTFARDKSIHTILPYDRHATIGQMEGLSDLDIQRIKEYYDCH